MYMKKIQQREGMKFSHKSLLRSETFMGEFHKYLDSYDVDSIYDEIKKK